MLECVIYSAIAGIIGTGIGGIIGVMCGKANDHVISAVLSFAGGVMLSVVFFDLIPESITYANYGVTIFGLTVGIVVLYLLNYLVDKKTSKTEKELNAHVTISALHHQDQFIQNHNENKSLLSAGIIMFIAIALHNFPEGMAIGTLGMVHKQMGLTLAILLAIHNIPEGMAISLPLVVGGIKKWKVVGLCVLAGSVTLLGGLVGVLLGSINTYITSFALSFAGGAMLYVTFCEILPQSLLMESNRMPSLFNIIGIIMGFALIFSL